MSRAAPWARFDDLSAGSALRFPPPVRIVRADRAAAVVPALTTLAREIARGAWAYGYLAYEAAAGLDPALSVASPVPEGPPLVWFGVSAAPRTVRCVAPGGAATGVSTPWRPDWSAAEHRAAVGTIRERIAAGDIYQCNLTDRLRARFHGSAEELYALLAVGQAGAHNAFLDLGRYAVASVSPELFFDWSGDVLTTRPMKGTARRGRTAEEDRKLADGLRSSAKDRAENLMIVDLLRNDLARVARIGSVEVPELFALEGYPTVWQLTSTITARTRPDVGLVDVFRALFPSGSITGAPKERTMQVIRGLEPAPRGVYCGAIGFIAPPGHRPRARFSVAIRTVVLDRATGAAVYGAGGGITWDSDADREWEELLLKAAVLARAHPDTTAG